MDLQTKAKLSKKIVRRRRNMAFEKPELPTKDTISLVNSDLSSLHKPIDTSASALHEVSKLLETGTEEVKSVLTYECDIIYECRVCRNFFRSVDNFMSHKREYCKEKFHVPPEKSLSGDSNAIINKSAVKKDRVLRSQAFKEHPQNEDSSTTVDSLNEKQKPSRESNVFNETTIENELSNPPNKRSNAPKELCSYLESIDQHFSAAYQSTKAPNTVDMDEMKTKIPELRNVMEHNRIMLQGQMPESLVEKSDSPIQMHMKEDELLTPTSPANNVICEICNAKLSTKKTLRVHMKTFHTAKLVWYVCPCCTNTFANTWSVYRHLHKVHKKSREQVRDLRLYIQEKIGKRETSAITRNTRKLRTSTLKTATLNKIANKYQTSISRAKSNKVNKNNKELQNSKGSIASRLKRKYSRRGKRLDTKISLPAHSQGHEVPINKCNETNMEHSDEVLSDVTPTNDRSVCETENVEAATDCNARVSNKKDTLNTSSEISLEADKQQNSTETSTRIQDVPNLVKENDIKKNCDSTCNSTSNKSDFTPAMTQNIDKNESLSANENSYNFVPDKDLLNLKYLTPKMRHKIRWLKKCLAEVQEDKSSLHPSLLVASGKEDSNLISFMKKHTANITDLQKLQCLLCKRKFPSLSWLFRHLPMHVDLNENPSYLYRCKLCEFKHTKSGCIIHFHEMHGRTGIEESIIEISHDEYMRNRDTITDVTNKSEIPSDSDITSTVSSNQSGTSLDLGNSNNSSARVASQVEDTIITEQTVNSDGDIEYTDSDMNNLSDYMMGNGSVKLDTNPDLERQVLEVILGSDHTTINKQIDSDKATLKTDNGNASDDTDVKNKDKNNIAFITEPKKRSPSSANNFKHQRPKRNRVKAFSADFVYDLTLASWKENAFFNSRSTSVRKKSK